MEKEGYFWVGDGETRLDASQILTAYEAGEYGDDTPVRIALQAPARPLRSYMRELVYMAYRIDASRSAEELQPELYYTAFHEAPVALVITDLAGRITHANKAMCDLLGYAASEFQNLRVGELVSPGEDRTEEVRMGNEVLSGKRDSFQVERRYRHKDGTDVSTLLSVAMVRGADGLPALVLGQMLDLTRRKTLEQELAQSEKLKTAGRLAGGVAHDFNNLLTVILGELELVEDGGPKERVEGAANIREMCDLAGRMTQQLMAFSKEGVVELETLDANQEIRILQRVLMASLAGKADLHLELSGEVLPVAANSILLEQVLMNLVINGRNAMRDGGTLTVRTSGTDDQVCIEVVDTGVGMSEEVMGRVFEPFFTTRSDGGGTGLGMAMVYGTVARFGGTVVLESEEGRGTRVQVLLPRGDASKVVPTCPVSDVPQEPEVTRILLVDDQVAIVRIVERVLVREGYAVLTATNVSDANALIADASTPFDLLICDVKLPDGNGTQVQSALTTRWPQVPVLMMSGYTAEHIHQTQAGGKEWNLLQKPFVPSKLVESVQNLLGETASS